MYIEHEQWEQNFRRKLFTASISLKDKHVLGQELDRTAQLLKDISHHTGNVQTPSFPYETRINFFQQAKSEVIVAPIRQMGTIPASERWAKALKITEDSLKSETSLCELANYYGGSRENIRQTIKSTLMRLWVHASPTTQWLYPFFLLPTHKPESLKQTVQLETIPIRQPSSLECLAKATKKEDIQELLNQLSLNTITALPTKQKPSIKSLFRLVHNEAGFCKAATRHLPHFISTLKKAGLPYRTMSDRLGRNYTIIASSSSEEIIKALLADPNLAIFYGPATNPRHKRSH